MKNEYQGPPATGWTWIDNATILRAAEVGATALMIYAILALHTDWIEPGTMRSRICWPSLSRISKIAGLTPRSVRTAIRELERSGLVVVERLGGGSDSTRYLLPASPKEPGKNFSSPSHKDRKQISVEGGKILPGREEKYFPLTTDRELQTGNQKRGTVAEIGFPSELDNEQCRTAWGEWLAYRRERRLTCTPRTLNAQLCKLASWGPTAAIQAIENAIAGGWQGLFEPRPNGRDQAPAKPSYEDTLPLLG
ncbi:MAG: helix-turn-helix domain-containing protein [Pirellulales bacterium]|nr:helix-turn-helix domain-containing protein [Pirellulales bacterium]